MLLQRVIDVLKIDIETSEWEVLDNLMEAGLLSSVRQFSLEFHLFPGYPPFKDYVMLYKVGNLRIPPVPKLSPSKGDNFLSKIEGPKF